MPSVETPAASTAEQQRAVDAGGSHVLVLAGPGTGKTATIAARFRALVASGIAPERILTLTFSRRAAAELRKRLAQTVEASTQVEVRTFHGFAARLLEGNGPRFRSRRLLDTFAQRLVFKAALEDVAPRAYSRTIWDAEGFREEAAVFVRDLERAAPRIIDALRAYGSVRIHDLLDVATRVRELRARLRASDLDDLILRAVAAAADPGSASATWLEGRYAHVLVDELQDVDVAQFELLATLVRCGAVLFCVGDPAQAIYRFRGAAHGVVDTIRERFAMEVFELDDSRRCPQPICDLAAQTPLLKAKRMTSATERAGTIAVERARTPFDEAALIASRVESAFDRGVPAEKIAVLVRTLRPLSLALAVEFRNRAIPFLAPGRDALLADPLVEVIRGALEVLREPSVLGRWLHLLSAQALGFDPIAIRLASGRVRARDFALTLAAFDRIIAPGAFAWRDLARALRHANRHWENGDLGRCVRAFVRELGLYGDVIAKERDPLVARAAIARVHGFDALAAGQRTLRQLQKPASPANVVAQLDEHLDAFVQDSAPDTDVPGVRVLTVHGAKGLEFDLIVIGDAVEGRFPQVERPSALFTAGDREALGAAGFDSVLLGGDRQRIEEASLWYVAVTRSRRELLVTYACEDLDGTPVRPSSFIPPQYALRDDAPTYARSLERPEIAARRIGDGGLNAMLLESGRAPGTPLLAEVLRGGEAVFGELARRPLQVEKPVAVSAVADWFACPRRYYYGRLLRLRSESSTALQLGTLLHAILEAFHKDVTDFSAVVQGDVARWTVILHATLERLFEPSVFDTPADAAAVSAFLTRALATYARALYDDARSAPFRVEACEQSVEFLLGTGKLAGRIDRVDRLEADGTRVLRDYKSGRLKKPFIKALEHMQKTRSEESALTYAGLAVDFNPQLALYRLGVANAERFDYLYFRGQGEERNVIAPDVTSVLAVEAGLAMLVADVRDNLADALAEGRLSTMRTTDNEWTCRYCSFEPLCPGFGEIAE